ncbi:MAG TPA: serine/threonine-protein kinase [Sandaracinaceae bacterium LLY-WYZ-13_1]|nr:serine/threonine-protein kinase [Sandaracinaceae bacterium LLY-WYZ-13_1]
MAAEQRYRVVDRLEAGGMAEVFRGEALSVQGFKKQVAIKRVLPHLAQNKSFISMFLDEARLGARLNHANIVSVFDIGAADNTYFIVMEFVDGCNLKAVIEHFRQSGRRMPVKESIYIGMETCRGLSYAHELLGDEGEPLDIVHRDISPPNILLSKRGEIKVTDFGLAKSITQLEKTDPGVVKGKFSYLAPEAALGEGVDARADVFALGIVLWEMLAGRRLFLGETDYQTVKLVQQANIPSLPRLNPEVDEDLEKVLMGALTKDPKDRFESARDFGDALAGYLFSHQLKVTSYDIANMVKEVVEQRKSKKASKPQEASIIDRLIQEELLRFTSLDDMSDSAADPLVDGGQPLSPEDVAGAQPLDPLGFENPADWFADDPEVGDAVASASGTESEPGWRESGLEESSDLASLLEDEAPPPPRASAPSAEPAPPPRPSTPEPATPASTSPKPVELPAAPEPEEKSGGAMVWVLLATLLVLAGGAAAAWFGGLIPH